tara:strand:- start:21128 stop:21616 length:489 start_codon:yes stop_codon:yes gene_type:complete
MAVYSAAAFIGDRTVRPTDAQLDILADYERGLGDPGVARLWRHQGYFTQYMAIATTVNGGALTSLNSPARIPYKVVAVDLGCESAASTGVANIEREPAAGGGYVSMQEATVDIAAVAGAYAQSADITDGQEDVAFGDNVRLTVTAGAGDLVGAQALLHCFRL